MLRIATCLRHSYVGFANSDMLGIATCLRHSYVGFANSNVMRTATILEHTVTMPIPIGSPPTNTGDAYRSVTWYLEVTMRFRGRPDWVQTSPVKVVA